ncbi:MAG: hypothetical protein KGS48_16930 [Bacteroidetes bacterium]|nr:hypothetical protein [Bacteroidota bacterium]
MAKTPSLQLYQMIRALSPAEKRYFRIFIRGKTDRDSKYLALFEAMAHMDVFDDAALQNKIYPDEPISSSRYSALKAYLYDLILQCLQAYDAQHSIEFRINHLMQGVSVLFKRGLYDDCVDQLQKAIKIARSYERFAEQIEIIRWQKHLAYTRMDVDFLHKNLERLQYEESKAIKLLENLSFYRGIFYQMYTLIKQEAQHRSKDRLDRLHQLVQGPMFESADRARSHRARVLYYRVLNLYHYAVLDHKKFYDSGKQLIDLQETQPRYLKENLSDYIAGLSNLILACGLMRRYDEVRQYLQKLLDVQTITEDDRRKKHRQYFSSIFALYTFSGDFESARLEMHRCQEEAKQFNPLDYETAGFLGQYCYICFGCDDFDAALDYLNEWLSHSRTVEREDLQSLARIIQLIIHYEMGNMVLLESLLRSTARFMRKKNRLYDLERRIILFMANLMRAPDSRTGQRIFRKMKNDLQMDDLQVAVHAVSQVFDLDSWLQSKIEGRRFADVVKDKFEKEQADASE